MATIKLTKGHSCFHGWGTNGKTRLAQGSVVFLQQHQQLRTGNNNIKVICIHRQVLEEAHTTNSNVTNHMLCSWQSLHEINIVNIVNMSWGHTAS